MADIEMSASLLELQARARSRLPLRTAAICVVAFALYAGYAYLLGDRRDVRFVLWLLALTLIALLGWATALRFSTRPQVSPASGLRYAERRRVMQAVRRGQPTADPRLREVQLLCARNLAKNGVYFWLYLLPAGVMCFLASVNAAIGVPHWQPQVVTAALFTAVSAYQIVNARGARRLLRRV